MHKSELILGQTGYTDGAGLDSYPYTVIYMDHVPPKPGRKPKGWVKGSCYVNLTVQSDDLVWDAKPANALGSCTADTGFNGECKEVWFVANPNANKKTVRAIELPDGTLVCDGLGYRSYNRDSSF